MIFSISPGACRISSINSISDVHEQYWNRPAVDKSEILLTNQLIWIIWSTHYLLVGLQESLVFFNRISEPDVTYTPED